ncbi:MAG: YqeG family HAD IIIA-type phosphatase [Cyanobacteria bacterium M_DeepCast_200m_mx_001]|nr:YqeG family HAD IIIA-type phosphatase [Cyanobacteria bacterium M_DeepCast_200m_mx_001]
MSVNWATTEDTPAVSRASLTDLLQPDWVAQGTLAELPLEHLLERGIRALVLDVDRTLLPHRGCELPPAMEQWLRQAQAQLPLHLFSNNPSRSRIGGVAEQLGVPFTTSAGKPRRGPLRRVLDGLALPPAQVALVGDRVFTDVLVGNRLGLFTVLVKPVNADGQPCRHDRWQRLEVSLARLSGAPIS